MKKLPNTSRLIELFDYDVETGYVTRKTTGAKIKSKATNGYLRVRIDYQGYSLHRIIYKLSTGIDPHGYDIDHINGDRTDNRMENMRLVSRSDNMRNAKRYKTNTSGHVGVIYDRNNKKWEAQISIGYKNIKLGRYTLKKDAIHARAEAESLYGFHKNHGRGD